MENNRLFDIVERLESRGQLAEGHLILKEALSDFGLSHVVYGAVNLPTTKRERPLVAVSYAPEWERHYLQEGYVNIDPVVQSALGGILPIDWSTINITEPVIAKFFGEATEFKIGPNGLSIPIRGRHHEFALFSVTSEVKAREWSSLKKSIMRDLMMLSYYFHAWALRVEGIERGGDLGNLSMRERDCLKWRALGKSDWDISHVIGISERTVKFHLENARSKLGATNTTHAVAKATSLGLIAIP